MILDLTKAIYEHVSGGIRERFRAFTHAPKLRTELQRKDDVITGLKEEVRAWQGKFDRAWSAWHTLALETKSAEEVKQMADALARPANKTTAANTDTTLGENND